MKLPRLLLQVTHEWSSPSNKNMKAITNGTGFGLTGDDVSVFQVCNPDSGLGEGRGKAVEAHSRIQLGDSEGGWDIIDDSLYPTITSYQFSAHFPIQLSIIGPR